MKRVYIYCEGQTEEAFVNEVLYPFFQQHEVYVFPIVCTTKRTAERKYRGGVADYGKVRREFRNLCRSHPHELVTTLFDYYAMPADTPGIHSTAPDLLVRVAEVEKKVNEDIGANNGRFNFLVHEFEALLFSQPSVFSLIYPSETAEKLALIREEYPTPEHINNSPETAPSKRILQLVPKYDKVGDGGLLALMIGIDAMRRECPHFRAWTDMILQW